MEELVKIQEQLNHKLDKNKRCLNSSNSWQNFVTVDIAKEMVRQAIDDACFFFTLKRPKDFDGIESIKDKINNLKPGQSANIYFYEYNKNYNFCSYAHNSFNKIKISVQETPLGWKVIRKL